MRGSILAVVLVAVHAAVGGVIEVGPVEGNATPAVRAAVARASCSTAIRSRSWWSDATA